MNIAKIISERKAGVMKIDTRHIYNPSLSFVLDAFGFTNKTDLLDECDVNYAKEVLKTILWRDLAYRSELITENEAISRSNYLINELSCLESKFFTNGDFKNYHNSSSCCFSSLTEATFCAALFIINTKHATCIIVEDED